jgi:hypothetical protein
MTAVPCAVSSPARPLRRLVTDDDDEPGGGPVRRAKTSALQSPAPRAATAAATTGASAHGLTAAAAATAAASPLVAAPPVRSDLTLTLPSADLARPEALFSLHVRNAQGAARHDGIRKRTGVLTGGWRAVQGWRASPSPPLARLSGTIHCRGRCSRRRWQRRTRRPLPTTAPSTWFPPRDAGLFMRSMAVPPVSQDLMGASGGGAG